MCVSCSDLATCRGHMQCVVVDDSQILRLQSPLGFTCLLYLSHSQTSHQTSVLRSDLQTASIRYSFNLHLIVLLVN